MVGEVEWLLLTLLERGRLLVAGVGLDPVFAGAARCGGGVVELNVGLFSLKIGGPLGVLGELNPD